MELVAALVRDQRTGETLHRAIDKHAHLQVCERPSRLLAVARRIGIAAGIVDVEAIDLPSLQAVVRELRRRFPLLPIITAVRLNRNSVHNLASLVAAGASGVIVLGQDDIWSQLAHAMRKSPRDRATRALLYVLAPHTSNANWPTIEMFAEAARKGWNVTQLCSVRGIHPKTLARRLARSGLPAPASFLSWCRLMLAAELQRDRTSSVTKTAQEVGFSSALSLRRVLRRHASLKPIQLRAIGGPGALFRVLARRAGMAPVERARKLPSRQP